MSLSRWSRAAGNRALWVAVLALSCSVEGRSRCYGEECTGDQSGGRGSSPSVSGGSSGKVGTSGGSAGKGGTQPGGASTGGFSGSGSGGTTVESSGGQPDSGGSGGTSANGASGGTTSGPVAQGGQGGHAGDTDELGGAGAGGVPEPGTGGAPPSTLLRDCSLLVHMNEASWTTQMGSVLDSSGLGNHGTAQGTANTDARAKFGRGGAFDGGGHVDFGDKESLRPTTAFSIAVWTYPTQAAVNGQGLITKRWAFGDRTAFTLFIYSENRLFADIDGENERFASIAQVPLDAWTHVALVFDGSLPEAERARLYVNGNLDSTHPETSASIPAHDSPLEIGRLRDGGENFVGSLDEVVYWRRALTEDEIRRVYESRSAL